MRCVGVVMLVFRHLKHTLTILSQFLFWCLNVCSPSQGDYRLTLHHTLTMTVHSCPKSCSEWRSEVDEERQRTVCWSVNNWERIRSSENTSTWEKLLLSLSDVNFLLLFDDLSMFLFFLHQSVKVQLDFSSVKCREFSFMEKGAARHRNGNDKRKRENFKLLFSFSVTLFPTNMICPPFRLFHLRLISRMCILCFWKEINRRVSQLKERETHKG